MLEFDLQGDKSILVVRPLGALEAGDFARVAKAVDPYLLANGKLVGLLIEAPSFPGWHDFAALVAHLKFVRDHQRNIERVAAVTDSSFLRIVPALAAHFAHPDIKIFGSGEVARALSWLQSGS